MGPNSVWMSISKFSHILNVNESIVFLNKKDWNEKIIFVYFVQFFNQLEF